MYQVDLRIFQQYLGEYGLDIPHTNLYLRKLDQKVFTKPVLSEHKAVEEHVTGFMNRFVQ